MSWLTPHIGTECCYLTTTGRRSGNPHEIEIWFGVVDDTLYLISGNGQGADWYRNAVADPVVVVRIDEERRRGVSREVRDDEERKVVGDLMAAKYAWDGDPSIGLTRNAWCFEVPVLAVSAWTTA
jgi:deazaflavin-dependent oxidoreductase (nitroreductase family)